MYTYAIKKTSNGEYKEINKHFKLNVSKFAKHLDTLYFDVENEEVPFLLDMNVFTNIMIEQIQGGLIESLNYKDGVITTTIRDGNTIKNYTYDFSFNDFNNALMQSGYEELKRTVYRIVSIYNEDPNKYHTTEQKYLNVIYDIIEANRLPKTEDKDEILRILEVYNAHKDEILAELLNQVVFFDKNDNIVELGPRLRMLKLRDARYDVLSRMETAILNFVISNNSLELYQNYLSNLFIPIIEIEQDSIKELEEKYIEIPDTKEETLVSSKLNKVSEVIKRIRKK